MRYLVSACLLGMRTRYDGRHNRSEAVILLKSDNLLIPVCPEQLGGLPTPRPPAEIRDGDGADVLRGSAGVCTADGKDLAEEFIRGARQVLLLAELMQVDGAVLKTGSPSCGDRRIHDGSFEGRCRAGDGVTTALLKEHGIPVFSERSMPPRP